MILKKAFEAVNVGGAVIIFEFLMDNERKTDTASLVMSLNMNLMNKSCEITVKEC